MMFYFMVLCLAYIIECHPADYRQQPYIAWKYSSISHGVPFRNAVMPTTPSVKDSSKFMFSKLDQWSIICKDRLYFLNTDIVGIN